MLNIYVCVCIYAQVICILTYAQDDDPSNNENEGYRFPAMARPLFMHRYVSIALETTQSCGPT